VLGEWKMTHKALVNTLKHVFNNKGQSMTEYILVIGLIALAVIASLPPLEKILIDKFTEFAAAISTS
jgi:Flp pilus assembly pilin Flp